MILSGSIVCYQRLLMFHNHIALNLEYWDMSVTNVFFTEGTQVSNPARSTSISSMSDLEIDVSDPG